MKSETLLKNIGFSDKDAKVYKALLKLGEANIQAIADETSLPRSTIYTRIEKLTDFGAIDVFQKKKTKYYIAAPPEKLINIIREHAKKLENNIDIFKDIAENARQPNTDLRLFEGVEGIKLVLNDILDEKRPFLAITSIKDMERLAQDDFELFIERRIENRLSVKLITNETKEAKKLKAKDGEEFRVTRFTPSQYNFNTATYVYGNKIAMLSLRENPVLGIIIEDAAMANTHRMYFDILWDKLK
ncbi:MAG: helix-turn-helix domain-containing protein [Candidatus Spechtbacterales bacterium]|nr:helix-turn-helix domain-containing protein [Candidatus Spechtbacterales bacterium]